MARVIFKEGVKCLFVYGSLRVPEIRAALLGAEKPHLDGALLRGFRPFRLRERRYPALLPDTGSIATGTLITGEISDDDWKILDAFEDEYIRTPVVVDIPTAEGNSFNSFESYVYLWPDPEDRMIRRDGPGWSLESFVGRRDAIEDFLENTRRFREVFLNDGSASSGDEALDALPTFVDGRD
jgi:gamma-glutamylcyclotransferase (GGCT)/AIG2-like uncharacterized protein YtfP